MEKLLFVAAWGGAVIALALAIWRGGASAALSSIARGMNWEAAAPEHLPPQATQALLWLVHAGGLVYLWRLAGRAYPEAIPLGVVSAAALLLPQFPALLQRKSLDVTPLGGLFVAYLAAALWGLGLIPDRAGQTLLPFVELGAIGYVLLAQAQRWRPACGMATGIPLSVALLLTATAGWALLEYFGARTRGVTGSDPYCYAQMAVDLARRGDPRHSFSLFPLIRDLGIPWWPIVHVGYYPPAATTGVAPTVWPVGWPALLAVGYRLWGEGALYLGAPVAGLLSLMAVALLVSEIWPGAWPRARWLGLALAVLIIATSREQVLWLLVPMADVPTQLFTALAVWLALRAGNRGSWPSAALAGAALGVAYDMRHTQVLLVPVVALALWAESDLRRRWRLLIVAGAATCLAAAPDLLYHQLAFGSLWRPESPELNLIGLRHWWGNARRMAVAFAAPSEFGLLAPILGYGLWRLWCDRRRSAAVLVLWIVLGAGGQFLYGPLRWRDLLAIAPPLAVLSAYGMALLLARVRRQPRLAGWAPGWMALGLALLLSLRAGPVLRWPLEDEEAIFGYMTAPQRQAFDLLAQSVEGQAVVGTSLNGGSVELYTGREAFRPGDWSEGELETFFRAMAAAGKPVYILDDGNEQHAIVIRLQRAGRLVALRPLAVSLYGDRGQLSGMLYRVKP